MDVAKKADRTAYNVWYIGAEPNRRKCRVWNSRGHWPRFPWLLYYISLFLLCFCAAFYV